MTITSSSSLIPSVWQGVVLNFTDGSQTVIGTVIKSITTNGDNYVVTYYTATDDALGDYDSDATNGYYRPIFEYGSPLLNGDFLDEGGLLIQNSETNTNYKVYKPHGCYQIIMSYITSTLSISSGAYYCLLTIDFDDTETELDGTLDFYTSDSPETHMEITNHEEDKDLAITEDSEFRSRPHELQINGSNFNLNYNDYMDPYKLIYNSKQTYLPYYYGYSGSLGYQKFFIGYPIMV